MELSELIAKSGKVIDLGSDTYTVRGSVAVTGDRVLVGTEQAVIQHYPSNDRDCACLTIRGKGTRLEGRVKIIGSMPSGAPYSARREAQHGINVESSENTFIGPWMVTNVYGDGLYVSKRDRGYPWTKNITIDGLRFDECGRCSFTLQAVDGVTATKLDIQRSNMSVLDMEPNGADWGCKNFAWTDSLVRDHGGGFVVASIGQGRTNSVSNIKLIGIRCPNRIFNMNIRPPEGTRRSNFWVENCSGGDIANTSPLLFTRVDGITVKNVSQLCASKVPLAKLTDCTKWDLPWSKSPNPPPEF